VIDRFGNVVDDDGDVVRDGHKLRVPVELMDGNQRATAEAAAQVQRVRDARRVYLAELGRGMHRHRVTPDDVADGEPADRRPAAYQKMKERLSARRQRKPAVPHRGWL
jgi:hypothetical protein